MTQPNIEEIYETLARTIDTAGPERSELFLAKLALALGHALGDPARIAALAEDCLQNLP